MNNIVFASVISEIQQSPMFMTVKAVICDTPEANLNGAKVTEKFVNEVVKNEKRYVGLPLYADVKALVNGSYNRLGHLYDVKTGEFHSTQIGSFYQFAKEEFENGYHLIGYARIPKRNKKLSNAIAELFAQGRLKFSFEVNVGEYEENDDGTITIDASENNYLEGTAIVTYPACEDAVALELVAQKAEESTDETVVADETGKGEKEMAEVEKAEVVETEAKVTEVAETEVNQPELAEKEEAEETKEENKEETASEEDAACKDKKEKAEEETAQVYVREESTQSHEVHAYDSETGKAMHQQVVVRTSTEDSLEGTLVEADDGMHVAEAKETAESSDNSGVAAAETKIAEGGEADSETTETTETTTETNTETTTETPAEPAAETPATRGAETVPEEEDVNNSDSNESKKTAELIAELTKAVEELRKEVAELKETKIVATKTVTAEMVNPMVADINAQKKYSLLEKVEKSTNAYSLLEKY